MILIEVNNEYHRIDGVGKKKVHLERVDFYDQSERKENGLLKYTEDYSSISRKEFDSILESHLSAMREQEKEFQRFQNGKEMFCRDCADNNGICPYDGKPCDPDEINEIVCSECGNELPCFCKF